jgi:RNA polymerase sigma-70 factor (ECF subfamily)
MTARRLEPEAALMLRVQDDEPGAFSELVNRFGRLVFARLYRSLPDRHEAEDLTQEVFLRLFRSRKRYVPRAKFTTWLYFITQNVARNAIRSRRRHAWLQLGCIEAAEERVFERVIHSGEYSPGATIERHEAAERVRMAIAHLMGRQRKALEMQQFQNRSCREIAAALQLSPKAAKSLLYRARLQLRELLSEA